MHDVRARAYCGVVVRCMLWVDVAIIVRCAAQNVMAELHHNEAGASKDGLWHNMLKANVGKVRLHDAHLVGLGRSVTACL